VVTADFFVNFGEFPEGEEFLLADVRLGLFRKHELVNPVKPGFGQNDRAMTIIVESLLPDPTSQVICLAVPDVLQRVAQLIVVYERLLCRCAEALRFENPFRHIDAPTPREKSTTWWYTSPALFRRLTDDDASLRSLLQTLWEFMTV
jgi:hypothetical protein